MSTRKIKDAKDLSTNELIYFKGHAQATYMSDGRSVEEAINQIGTGGDSGEGGGSSSGRGEGTPVVTQNGAYIDALQPNVITIITDPVQSLYIEDFVTSSSKHDEYTIIFSTAAAEPDAPNMTLPDYVRWANGSIPTLEWHTVYEFSITRDFLKIIPEGEFNYVEQSIYKAVLTPFKSVE